MRQDDTPDYEREIFLKNRLDALLRLIVGKFYDKNAPGYRFIHTIGQALLTITAQDGVSISFRA
jgi:hypothetical protein